MMGMFKTALYAHLDAAASPADLLTRVNSTLLPLRRPNMFVTAACLHRSSATTMEITLAGHPPLLHLAKATGKAHWVGQPQLAIGLTDDVEFRTETITVAPGDLLVVITDGLLEVFDRQDRELGADGLLRVVQQVPQSAALAHFDARIFDTCRAHGPQLDDQTLLLIRVL